MAKRIALPARLDTAASRALRDELVAAEGEDLILDAVAVEQIGALCLELIMSSAAIWREDGFSLALENLSAQMAEDLGHFGLTPETVLEYAA